MKLTEKQAALAGNYGLDPDAINEEFNPRDYLFCALGEMGFDEIEAAKLMDDPRYGKFN